MKAIWVFFLILLFSCGKHEQSLSVGSTTSLSTIVAKDSEGQAFNAVIKGDVSKLISLLEIVDIDIQNDQGDTLLLIAVENLQYQIIEILIDHGADPAIENQEGRSAGELISEDQLLLSLINQEDLSGNFWENLLLTSVEENNLVQVRYILSKDLNINHQYKLKNDFTILMIAVGLNNIDIVKLLLEVKEIDIDIIVVKEFRRRGRLIRVEEFTARNIAQRNGFTDILDLLN